LILYLDLFAAWWTVLVDATTMHLPMQAHVDLPGH